MQSYCTCLQQNSIEDGKYGGFANDLTNVSDLYLVETLLLKCEISLFSVWVAENTETTNTVTLTLQINGVDSSITVTILPEVTGCISTTSQSITIPNDSLVCWKATGNSNLIKLTSAMIGFEE